MNFFQQKEIEEKMLTNTTRGYSMWIERKKEEAIWNESVVIRRRYVRKRN